MRTLIFPALLLLCCGPLSAAEKPNILLILIDDMSWADPGCYGNRFHETPHIDALAAQGMRFTDFYSAGAVCSPTRASIQSGQNQARLEITDFIPGHNRPYAPLRVPPVRDHLPLEIVTPAEAVRTQGYVTGYFGKWHLGGPAFEPDNQGYDVSLVSRGRHFAPRFQTNPETEVPDGTYLADFLTDRTIEFIQEHRDRPFFAMLSHYVVHIPLEAKEQMIQKYREKPKPPVDFESPVVKPPVYNPVYAAMVEHTDESVGRLMDALDELGLAENTLVIFTSDNGGLYQTASARADSAVVCSNAPLRDEKGSLYEGGIRVPLICRWPGVIPPGSVSETPATTIDFWPTIAEAAGVGEIEHQELDGLSLLPVLRDPDAGLDRDALYFHFPHYHHSRPAGAIRVGDWKLIEFFEDGRLELYHLAEDLSEEKNLAERHPERAGQMQRRLAGWREEVGAVMPTPNPDHDPDRELEILRRPRNR
jgi:arylsulfatase A